MSEPDDCSRASATSESGNLNKMDLQAENSSDVKPSKSATSTVEYPVRRNFSGSNNDVWNEYIRYFENVSELNNWNKEKARRVLLSTFRGQAETYAYGMPLFIQHNYDRLIQKMDERFGHTAMKERYITEAKLRRRHPNEPLRDFGQAIEDLLRRAYPSNPEIVEENAIKSFLDKCGQSEDFRLSVKRLRPRTLQEAVFYAMQEECLRAGERDLVKETRPNQKQMYEVENPWVGDYHDYRGDREVASSDERLNYRPKFVNYREKEESRYEQMPKIVKYCEKDESRYNHNNRFMRGGMGSQGRPYTRQNVRGRGRPIDYRDQSFRTQGPVVRRDSEKPLN